VTADDPLAAIARIRERGDGTDDDVAFLVGCLGGATKAVQRRAAEALAALDAAGVAVRDAIVPGLAAPAQRARFGAAYALSLLGPSPAVSMPVLLETLGSDDGDVRWAAATILLPFGADVLVEPLCELARSGNPAQRKMALYCLRDVGPVASDVEPDLRSALRDAESSVRLAAMAALARLGRDRAAVSLALLPLLDDVDVGVRRAAAATLGRVGVADDAVRGGLQRAAAGDDGPLARAAAAALTRLRRP
jgi:HEAT repeat protein